MAGPLARATAEGLRAWLRAMPKAELHLHLDGSLRPESALEIARQRGLGWAEDLDVAGMRARLVAPERCLDQAELLAAFELPVSLLQGEDALARAAAELVEDLAAEGTRYAEIRWAPSLHTREGLSLDTVVRAVVDAAGSAATLHGIEVRLIAVAIRTQPARLAVAVAGAAGRHLERGLTGFDLAGPEAGQPDVGPFTPAFEIARAAALGLTCHAGEWGGAPQVRGALRLRPWRIAHGAPAAEDEALLAELAAAGITLDLCPSSNVQVGLGTWGPDAPWARLVRSAVRVTLSTDDRTVSDLTLVTELERAVERLGLSPTELLAIVRHAYEAAFLHHDEALRRRLLASFDAWAAASPAPW